MPVKYKGILKIIFGIYTRCQQIDVFLKKIGITFLDESVQLCVNA